MKLFQIVPADFFSVLVSPNRELYFDALMKLYEMFNLEIYIYLKAFLAEVELLLEDRQYIAEEGDEEEPEFGSLRGKARLIEKRLEKTRWVEREYLDGSFIEILTPPPYAITVMRTLHTMTQEGAAEYNSLVFSTYSALKQAHTESRDRMYEALIVARSNTEKLDYELRTFYHGIRGYMRVIRENSDVNLLLQNHFEAYKKDSDRVYHPVKTMDSFYRYTGPIRSILADVHADEELIAQMTQKALATRSYASEADAREDILSAIERVMDSYQQIAGLIKEIDLKHSSLTKQSIDKIRYVMTADRTIKGKLVELLRAYAQSDGERETQLGGLLEEHICVNRQEYMDKGSCWHKNSRQRRSNRPPLPLREVNEADGALLSKAMERLKNSYSEARVRQYMEGLFTDGRTSVSSEEIPVANDGEYILTLLSVVRAFRDNRRFQLEFSEGSTEKNGYRIPRFVLKKGGRP